jgi:putative oxidoreductase
MSRDFDRYEPMAYAALRIVAGSMFLFHGVSKLFGWPGHAVPFGSQLWVGGVIELVGGALIALGLLTRPAALLASGTMAVAYFQFHWKLEFANWAFLPIVNQGEPAVLYCFVFLLIAIRGAGIWSLDRARR